MSTVKYRETIWSDVFAGNQHTSNCLRPAVLGAENALELDLKRRQRVVWRIDGGGGSDDHIRWLLSRGYQVMVKGASNRRAEALSRQVTRWDTYRDAWLGQVDSTIDFGRPVQVIVKKRPKKDGFCHSYYVSTLKMPSKGTLMAKYDDRGGAEVEQFRNDKSGLHLAARRKRRFPAQKALILLTDLAHNLLADFHHTVLSDAKFAGFGPKRMVRDLLAIPGMLTFEGTQLKRIDLLESHPHAKSMLICLKKHDWGE
ncbi:MAG: hypothetical protein GY841_10455 [FCB group bacterium]|nr:hypothetical protein [FCB group bacterium]